MSALLVKMPPPTREKRATLDAPIPKPWIECAVSGSPPKKRYRVPSPSSPSEATASPMMDPPKNATARASSRPLVCAATVVRTFARVAVRMPMRPAAADATAPATKERAVL